MSPANLAACALVGRDVVCLCYHAVSRDWPCSLAVDPEQLERQLSWLLDRGFTGATFSQAVLDPPAQRTLAVTFDDAYASVIDRGFPILQALGIPGTVFAPTAFMSARGPLRWPGIDQWLSTPHAGELTSMDWSDLKRLLAHGWEVGSHTCTHPRLDELPDAELKAELDDSRAECATQLGGDCVSLAYPYGRASRRVAEAARKAGYQAAATIPPAPDGWDRLRHPRIGVYHVDRPARFKAKVRARHLYDSFVWRGFTALRGAIPRTTDPGSGLVA